MDSRTMITATGAKTTQITINNQHEKQKDGSIKKIKYEKPEVIMYSNIIKENQKTIWVKLPDGNVIKKHKTTNLKKLNELALN